MEEAILHHDVPRDRQQRGYFARRCFYEGVLKALIRRLGGRDALSSERSFAATTLPQAIARELGAGYRHGHFSLSLQRGAAILIGLSVTVAGFALGSVFYLLRRPRRSAAPPVDPVAGP